jgi:hypothetical protein
VLDQLGANRIMAGIGGVAPLQRTIAVIGAWPVGLVAAAHGLEARNEVCIDERTVGVHIGRLRKALIRAT